MNEVEPVGWLSNPHRTKLHSTNPIERLNGEIKRRIEVIGTFSNEAAIKRLVGPSCSNKTTNARSSEHGAGRRIACRGKLTSPALAGDRGGHQQATPRYGIRS